MSELIEGNCERCALPVEFGHAACVCEENSKANEVLVSSEDVVVRTHPCQETALFSRGKQKGRSGEDAE